MEKLKPKSWLKKPLGKRPILRLRRREKKEIIACMVGK
jgi:hypothetical protein